MKRIIGLDVGDVRIGIAKSDIMRIIASPLETYVRTSEEKDFDHIAEIVKREEADTIVLGLPIKMDGTDSPQTVKVREFKDKLAEKLPHILLKFIDERMTSKSAERALLESDMSRKKRKENIDKVAAAMILDTYLKILG